MRDGRRYAGLQGSPRDQTAIERELIEVRGQLTATRTKNEQLKKEVESLTQDNAVLQIALNVANRKLAKLTKDSPP